MVISSSEKLETDGGLESRGLGECGGVKSPLVYVSGGWRYESPRLPAWLSSFMGQSKDDNGRESLLYIAELLAEFP